MLPRVLLHALHVVCPPSKFVLSPLKEFEALLAHVNHPIRRIAKHLHDSSNLVILGRSGEEGQSQEQLHHDTAQ